jgi:hypothetical protein
LHSRRESHEILVFFSLAFPLLLLCLFHFNFFLLARSRRSSSTSPSSSLSPLSYFFFFFFSLHFANTHTHGFPYSTAACVVVPCLFSLSLCFTCMYSSVERLEYIGKYNVRETGKKKKTALAVVFVRLGVISTFYAPIFANYSISRVTGSYRSTTS